MRRFWNMNQNNSYNFPLHLTNPFVRASGPHK